MQRSSNVFLACRLPAVNADARVTTCRAPDGQGVTGYHVTQGAVPKARDSIVGLRVERAVVVALDQRLVCPGGMVLAERITIPPIDMYKVKMADGEEGGEGASVDADEEEIVDYGGSDKEGEEEEESEESESGTLSQAPPLAGPLAQPTPRRHQRCLRCLRRRVLSLRSR